MEPVRIPNASGTNELSFGVMLLPFYRKLIEALIDSDVTTSQICDKIRLTNFGTIEVDEISFALWP